MSTLAPHRRWIILTAGALAAAHPAAGREWSLQDALRACEENSPALKASRAHEAATREGVGAARAAYFPILDLDAVDSWGFSGSSSYLGMGGLMGSPYRSGAATGLVARETLFDFGRTYQNVRAARSLERLQEEQTRVEKVSVDLDALQTFYQCSRFRSEHEVWDRVHAETELVAKEVSRYVDTGQRSLVDRYLADAQVEEARTNRNYFKSRMNSTAGRLAMLMGAPADDVSCPALPALDADVPVSTGGAVNPFILRSQSRVDAAQTKLSAAKADYLPRIVGVASAGTMERVRLVNREDWSGGLGVTVPLFNGFGTVSRVGEARAGLEASHQELAATELQVEETNARYDEIIDASKARIEHLQREETLAQEGFRVAKNRYFKFQGTLVDLRDALRNLGRIEAEMKDTQADWIQAGGAKALVNGGSTRH